MRTVSCPLVIVLLFSLPWRLNSNVTPAINTKRNNGHITDHQQSTHEAEGSSDLTSYSTDAGEENVVSLSGRVQTQHLTSESEQHMGGKTSSAHTLNQRTKRNTGDNGNNFTTPKGTTKLSSSLRTQDILNTTEFTSPVQPPTEETTTKEVLDTTEHKTQETKQEMPSSFTSTSNYVTQPNITDVHSNKISTNSDVQTVRPTPDTTVQLNTMTHTHTFTRTHLTDSTETKSMKTTKKKEITPERTTSTTKSLMILTSTLKTTPKVAISSPNNTQKNNPGKAVAAVIGTTLILMFIAIIFILVRKRKIQKKQLENPEWAGPSPFLDVDVQPNLPSTEESESVNRRGFSQISKYLPQRLSKHLTFGRDTDEEVFMGDILQGSSTFGTHNVEEVQATNGEPTLIQDSPKTKENENNQGASVDSADTKSPAVPVDIKESDNQNDDVSKTSSQNTVLKALPPLVSIDLDSLSEETAPSQTPDVPPAPPLP